MLDGGQPAMSRALMAFIALLAAVACGGSPEIVPLTQAVPETAPSEWQTVYVPWQSGSPETIFVGPGGATNYVVGGLRFTTRGLGEPEHAADATLWPIVGAAISPGCALFASEDGALFRASSFLGSLRRIAETVGVAFEPYFADGRSAALLLRGADERAYLANCEGELQPIALPESAPLLGSAWATPRFGVVAHAPGRVWRTLDGGRRFELLGQLEPGPTRVFASDGLVRLETERGAFTVAETGPTQGAASSAALARPHASRPTTPNHGPDFLRRFEARRWSEAFLDAGTIAMEAEAGLWLIQPGADPSFLRWPGRDCVWTAARSQLLAACDVPVEDPSDILNPPESTERHVYASSLDATAQTAAASSAATWRAIHDLEPHGPVRRWTGRGRRPPRDLPPVLLTDRSGGVVSTELCAGESQRAERQALCWFDGTEAHQRWIPVQTEVLALRGATLLVRSGDRIVFCDLSASEEPSLVPTPAGSGGFVGATDVVALVRHDRTDQGTETELGVGAIGGPYTWRALPDGVRRVAFADERHGMAVGPGLFDVHTTDDLGRSWRRLVPPFDPSGFGEPAARAAALRCDRLGCRFGQTLWGAPSLLSALPAEFRVQSAESVAISE